MRQSSRKNRCASRENSMRESPENEILAKVFAHIDEKCVEIWRKIADFRPSISRRLGARNFTKNPLQISRATKVGSTHFFWTDFGILTETSFNPLQGGRKLLSKKGPEAALPPHNSDPTPQNLQQFF